MVVESRRVLSKHLRIDDGAHLAEHMCAASEDHLLGALRVALDEIDARDAVRLNEAVERIDGADDLVQAIPALALPLIAFLEVVCIGDGTQRRRLVRRRQKVSATGSKA